MRCLVINGISGLVLILALFGCLFSPLVHGAEADISVDYSPKNPHVGDTVTVSATVNNIPENARVELWYQTCEGSICNMPKTKDMGKTDGKYTATIGPITSGTTKLEFKVIIYDGDGAKVLESEMTTVDITSIEENNTYENGGKEKDKVSFIPAPGGILVSVAFLAAIGIYYIRFRR